MANIDQLEARYSRDIFEEGKRLMLDKWTKSKDIGPLFTKYFEQLDEDWRVMPTTDKNWKGYHLFGMREDVSMEEAADITMFVNYQPINHFVGPVEEGQVWICVPEHHTGLLYLPTIFGLGGCSHW